MLWDKTEKSESTTVVLKRSRASAAITLTGNSLFRRLSEAIERQNLIFQIIVHTQKCECVFSRVFVTHELVH